MEEKTSGERILDNHTKRVKEKMLIAIRCIDKEFGEGFAKNNITLVASFMHSIEMEEISSEIYDLREVIENQCEEISTVLDSINNVLAKK